MTLGFVQIQCVGISVAKRPINRSALLKHAFSTKRHFLDSVLVRRVQMFLLEGLMAQV